jgi:hypothetical protein
LSIYARQSERYATWNNFGVVSAAPPALSGTLAGSDNPFTLLLLPLAFGGYGCNVYNPFRKKSPRYRFLPFRCRFVALYDMVRDVFCVDFEEV